MITFKEYYQGDKYNAALASPNNGKSMMRGDSRVKQNLVKKNYLHKSPHVDNLLNGGATDIKLQGQPLLNTLSQYGVDFKPGETKTLGNSRVYVKMFKDAHGTQCGILTKK